MAHVDECTGSEKLSNYCSTIHYTMQTMREPSAYLFSFLFPRGFEQRLLYGAQRVVHLLERRERIIGLDDFRWSAHVERYDGRKQRRKWHERAIKRPNSCTITPVFPP